MVRRVQKRLSKHMIIGSLDVVEGHAAAVEFGGVQPRNAFTASTTVSTPIPLR